MDDISCDALSANTFTAGLTTARPSGTATNVSSLTLPCSGDQSQAWCRVTGAAASAPFRASLLVNGDTSPGSYLPCLTVTTGGGGKPVASTSSSQFANGVVLMTNCTPTVSHSVSVRVLNSAGVFEVLTCGTTAGGAYIVKGAVVYAGAAASSLVQLNFSPAANVRYGMQQLNYV